MRKSIFIVAALAMAWPALASAQEGEAPPVASGVTIPVETSAAPVTAAEPPRAAQSGETAEAPPLIEPQNALEFAFVSALTNEGMRPIFRRYLMDTHVALALESEGADAAVREVQVREGFVAGAVFTSADRLTAVLGEDAPHIVINGRAAFQRLRGKNVVINPGLAPMLTLEAEDVSRYLETPGAASAGPSQ